MPLLVRNGRVITASDDLRADVYAQGETITRIESAIDPHVHIYLPFMGTYAVYDYTSASKAALAGGTTTLIEMICPGPKDDPYEAFELWRSKAQGLAALDYTFHMSVVRFEDDVRERFHRIVKTGIASFKVFLAYKGALNLYDEHLFALMGLAKQWGVIVTAHCENADAIDAMQRALIAAGRTGTEWH